MIKLIRILFFIVTFSGFFNAYSQSCGNYAVSRTTSITYSSIEGNAPSYFTWRNLSSNQDDDNRSYEEPIGFDFWYLGIRYTHFSGNLNGTIDFSSSTSDGNNGGTGPYGPNYNNLFSTANQTELALAPFYDDLWTAGGGTTPIASSMFFQTSGSAPNRVLTIEWENFDKWNSSSGSLNFQVKLHETTGVIEFIYGNMSAGTEAFSYTCGINGDWNSGSPGATHLLTQQTANSTNFNHTPKNNLSVLPEADSKITFTPPVPSAPPTGLSFSSVGQTAMTLHWTDNATNEVGYAIYYSIDGLGYVYAGETGANTTSATINSLYPGTAYAWQVHAVTEGDLGIALTGTEETLPAGEIRSIKSGSWSHRSTWDCHCTPTPGDDVTIADGHTVTLDANAVVNLLTVGEGSSGELIIGNSTTHRTLTVDSHLVIQPGATVVTGSHNATHTLIVDDNIINNGTLNLAPSSNWRTDVVLNNFTNSDQTISGTGATTHFHNITVDLSNAASKVTVMADHFTAADGFLTISNGTFELASPADIIPFTGNVTIPIEGGIWLNHPGASMLSTGGSVTLLGSMKVSSGTFNIGNAADNNLIFDNGSLIMEGGYINVAGRLDKLGITALTNINISSGTLTLATEGSTVSGRAPFTIDETGSDLTMSGGNIVIRNPGADNLGYINTGATNGNITGGTVQIGDENSSPGSTFQINTNQPLPSLVIGNTVPVSTLVVTNPLTIKYDLEINNGTFNGNDQNINLAGDFINNATFVAGTGTVVLNGTGDQQLTGSTIFTYLTVNKNSGLVNLVSEQTIANNLHFTAGKINLGNNNLSISAAGAISGASSGKYVIADGTGSLKQQVINGGSKIFPVGIATAYIPVTIELALISLTDNFSVRVKNEAYSRGETGNIVTTNAVKATWLISEDLAGNSDATITLQWPSSLELPGFNRSLSRLAHYTDSWDYGNIDIVASGTDPYTVSRAGFSEFSPFAVSMLDALPVHWYYVKGLHNNGNNEIQWATLTEQNTRYFEIEYADDGTDFTVVGKRLAAGNSSALLEYSFIHKNIDGLIAYYRIKQVDRDGRFSYSAIIKIAASPILTTRAVIAPNPAHDFINVKMDMQQAGNISLHIYNLSGKAVFSGKKHVSRGSNSFTIDFTGKAPGIYHLKLEDEQGYRQLIKFIKK